MQFYEETVENGVFKVRLTDLRTEEERDVGRTFLGKIKKAILGEGKPAGLLWKIHGGCDPKDFFKCVTFGHQGEMNHDAHGEFWKVWPAVMNRELPNWVFCEFRISMSQIKMAFLHRPSKHIAEVIVPMPKSLDINFCITPTPSGTEVLYQLRINHGSVYIDVYDYESGKRKFYSLEPPYGELPIDLTTKQPRYPDNEYTWNLSVQERLERY